jgi:hypothetical protein
MASRCRRAKLRCAACRARELVELGPDRGAGRGEHEDPEGAGAARPVLGPPGQIDRRRRLECIEDVDGEAECCGAVAVGRGPGEDLVAGSDADALLPVDRGDQSSEVGGELGAEGGSVELRGVLGAPDEGVRPVVARCGVEEPRWEPQLFSAPVRDGRREVEREWDDLGAPSGRSGPGRSWRGGGGGGVGGGGGGGGGAGAGAGARSSVCLGPWPSSSAALRTREASPPGLTPPIRAG